MNDYFIPIITQSDLQVQADIFKQKVLPKVSWKFIIDARGKFIYIQCA